MARSFLGSALFCVLALGGAASACNVPRWEDVSVARWSPDPVLADGRMVRLAGLVPSRTPSGTLLGPARLHVLSRSPDRWGRVAAFVTPPGAGMAESLNLAALREGNALAAPDEWPPGCFAEAVDAERTARAARRGLWVDPPIVAATDVAALRAREGRFTLIAGQVRSVRQGRRKIFINFGPFGAERFTATLPLGQRDAFVAAGVDPLALRGSSLLIRGVVGPGLSMELSRPEAVSLSSRP